MATVLVINRIQQLAIVIILVPLTDLYTVAVIKVKEDYQNISTGFKDIFADINNLISNPVISIQHVDYEVIFYLCSDYKVINILHYSYMHNQLLASYIVHKIQLLVQDFYHNCILQMLLLLTGLKAANSAHACVWCNIHKDDRY